MSYLSIISSFFLKLKYNSQEDEIVYSGIIIVVQGMSPVEIKEVTLRKSGHRFYGKIRVLFYQVSGKIRPLTVKCTEMYFSNKSHRQARKIL